MATSDFDADPLRASDIPASSAAAVAVGSQQIGDALSSNGTDSGELTPLRKGYIATLYLAHFSIFLAFVTPIAFSLAIRVEQVAPDTKDSVLALAAGIPGLIAVVLTPIFGALSDRTRSKLGRRRPWMIAGILVGLVGSTVIGLATGPAFIVVGWTFGYVGYTVASSMVLAHLGDKLPESQRGRVLGITGAISQMAPLAGVLVGGLLSTNALALFLVPGLIALVGATIFLIRMKDTPRAAVTRTNSTGAEVRKILVSMVFNPKRYPNLGWVWISKAFIYFALSFSTIYTIYLITSRFEIGPTEVAGVLAISGILGVGCGVGGAILSGFLSDKFGTRKPFLVISALIMAAGLIIVATSTSLPVFLAGNAISALATGVYGAVDQALALDVLPREEDENGRYLGILQLGSTIPQAVGPLAAGLLLAIAGGAYSSVYFAAAVLAVLGAITIIPISIGRRASMSTTSLEVPK